MDNKVTNNDDTLDPAPHDPDQAYYWTAEQQAAEQASRADFAAGRFKLFSTMDDFIEDLMNDDDL